MKEILRLVFCKPSGISLFTHLLASLHLLYLTLNSEIGFGRKECECLTVLVLSALYLPSRSTCLQPYSLCRGCVGSFTISNILFVVHRCNNVSRSSCFLPTIPPCFSYYFVQCVLVLFLNATSPTDEGKA